MTQPAAAPSNALPALTLAPPPRFAWAWWATPWVLLALSAPLWLHWYEPSMFLALNAACASVAAPVWAGLSMLGNAWGVIAITSPLLVLAPRLLWAWLCAAPFAIAFSRLGKEFIFSLRPASVVDNAQMRIVGEAMHTASMPSGHTLTAFSVATAIYLALPAQGRVRYVWLFALAAGTGLSRIAVGAHWPGDVAVGAALGVLAGMLGQYLLARMGSRHLHATAWSLRVMACVLVGALVALLAEAQDFAENQPLQYALAVVVTVSLAAFVRQNWLARQRWV